MANESRVQKSIYKWAKARGFSTAEASKLRNYGEKRLYATYDRLRDQAHREGRKAPPPPRLPRTPERRQRAYNEARKLGLPKKVADQWRDSSSLKRDQWRKAHETLVRRASREQGKSPKQVRKELAENLSKVTSLGGYFDELRQESPKYTLKEIDELEEGEQF